MGVRFNSVFFDNVTADPGTPSNGQVWYRSDLNEFRGRVNGATVTIHTDNELAAYLELDGTAAMTGDLDVGGNAISNVTTVDGVDVSDHSARHDPGGVDALTTAAAVTVGTANAEGAAVTFARSNHTHIVDGLVMAAQAQGNVLYYNGSAWVVLAPGTAGQFLQTNGAASNVAWASAGAGSSLVHKSGVVLAAAFAGSPMEATVSFSGAFSDVNYSVTTICRTNNDQSFIVSVEESTKVAGSFVLKLSTNSKTDLVAVEWMAIKHGES